MAEHQTRHPDRDHPINDDFRLAQEVKEKLLHGTESAGIDIHVSATDGAVRLYGVVDVLAHKTAAEQLASQIPGVRHIDNAITVANEGNIEDKELIEIVTEKLTHVPALRNVGCRVHRGRVELVGHVATHGDVMRAVRIAEDTMGAVVVTSRIKMGEGQEEDEIGASRGAERLLAQMGLNPALFEVYADAGTLFIKGFVRDDVQRRQVIRMMHRLEGVSKVEPTLVTDAETGGEIH